MGLQQGHIKCAGWVGLEADHLGDALVQGNSEEALCVFHLAQDPAHPIGHQIHHLQ